MDCAYSLHTGSAKAPIVPFQGRQHVCYKEAAAASANPLLKAHLFKVVLPGLFEFLYTDEGQNLLCRVSKELREWGQAGPEGLPFLPQGKQ